jgi:UDP-N-acetylglucosamine 4-epimerase
VICFDNFATGHRHNLKDFINHPNFNLIEGDILRQCECNKAVQGVDYVLHRCL